MRRDRPLAVSYILRGEQVHAEPSSLVSQQVCQWLAQQRRHLLHPRYLVRPLHLARQCLSRSGR
jgi:hypothetical protein